MKILLLFLSLYIISEKDFSQLHPSFHALQLQLEFGGPGILSSFNLDSRATKKENGIGYRFGIGVTPLRFLKHHCNTGSLNAFPLVLNYLIGKTKHLVELGGGGVVSFMSGTKVYCIDSTNTKEPFFAKRLPTIGLH
jgi:hypothetical protein